VRKRPESYNTRQSEAILRFLEDNAETGYTAGQIAVHFRKVTPPIGRTTVYRQLDKLVSAGSVRKYPTEDMTGAYYQFITNEQSDNYRMMCENCGMKINLKCSEIDNLSEHLMKEHNFKIDTNTVFYGKCDLCLNK
jgi:Fur family ferric uptake transcriptional regulator